jgi:hypothetical protein
MKIDRINYYGISLKVLREKLGDKFKFLGAVCIKGGYRPHNAYFAPNPDRSKGHKDILLTIFEDGQVWLTGMESKDFEEWAIVDGLYCHKCDLAIYSSMRHHYHKCPCGAIGIDGGRDYTKITWSPKAKFDHIKINLLKGTIKRDKKSKGKKKK